MRVKELMKRDVTTIGQKDSAADAMATMRNNRIRHLVVVDKQELIGVVADRDLLGRNDAELQRLRVGDVMSANPATVEPDEPISNAANRMRGRGIGCLPVLDHDRVVGIITTTDLLGALTRAGHTERPIQRDRPHRTANR